MTTTPLSRAAAQRRRLSLVLVLGLAASLAPAAPAVGERIRLVASLPDGSRISLEDARGRRTLLVFWSPASLAWRKSLGEFERFAAAPDAAAIHLITVGVDADLAGLRNFMAARGARFPFALRGEDNLGPLEEHRLPLLLVVDADGQLLRHHTGMFTGRTLRELLDPPAR